MKRKVDQMEENLTTREEEEKGREEKKVLEASQTTSNLKFGINPYQEWYPTQQLDENQDDHPIEPMPSLSLGSLHNCPTEIMQQLTFASLQNGNNDFDLSTFSFDSQNAGQHTFNNLPQQFNMNIFNEKQGAIAGVNSNFGPNALNLLFDLEENGLEGNGNEENAVVPILHEQNQALEPTKPVNVLMIGTPYNNGANLKDSSIDKTANLSARPKRSSRKLKTSFSLLLDDSDDSSDEDELSFQKKRNSRQNKKKNSGATKSEVSSKDTEESSKPLTKRKKRPYYRKNKHPKEVLERVEAERLKRKRLKNRELAARSRKRKKEKMMALEQENADLKLQVARLKTMIANCECKSNQDISSQPVPDTTVSVNKKKT